MNATEARIGQFVRMETVGQVMEITKNLCKVEVKDADNYTWTVFMPWNKVEAMDNKELQVEKCCGEVGNHPVDFEPPYGFPDRDV